MQNTKPQKNLATRFSFLLYTLTLFRMGWRWDFKTLPKFLLDMKVPRKWYLNRL